MPRRDWRIRVRDIHDAAGKIVNHTGDMDFETFIADQWTVDAVLRNLTVIGEQHLVFRKASPKRTPISLGPK